MDQPIENPTPPKSLTTNKIQLIVSVFGFFLVLIILFIILQQIKPIQPPKTSSLTPAEPKRVQNNSVVPIQINPSQPSSVIYATIKEQLIKAFK